MLGDKYKNTYTEKQDHEEMKRHEPFIAVK